MNGLPGVAEIRSISRTAGLGGHGGLQGRHRRLVRAPAGQRAPEAGRDRHPARLRPPRAGPGVDGARRDLRVLSGVEAATRRWSCARCSTGWSRYKLRAVPGVVEVNGMGGEAKQYQVVVDAKRLAAYRLALGDVERDPRAQQRRRSAAATSRRTASRSSSAATPSTRRWRTSRTRSSRPTPTARRC